MQSQQPPQFDSAFSYLTRLEQAVLAVHSVLPSIHKVKHDWTGVIFLSGSQLLLIPLTDVVEILQVHSLSPLPAVKSWLRGVGTSHGEIFPVTDFNAFLNHQLSAITPASRILVLKLNDEHVGILVDKVVGLMRALQEDIQPKHQGDFPLCEEFAVGTLNYESINTPIINLKLLCQHPKFRDVALRSDEFMSEE